MLLPIQTSHAIRKFRDNQVAKLKKTGKYISSLKESLG